MRCPKCSHLEDKVIDSRSVHSGDAIRRRRVCTHCGHRFTTYEEVVKAALKVIKRDGRIEEFSKTKLLAAIEHACIKRAISPKQIENMMSDIEAEIAAEYEREIPSTIIGRKVMDKLEKIDEVAYLRFVSIYRRFHDASQFLSEIENLIGRQ